MEKIYATDLVGRRVELAFGDHEGQKGTIRAVGVSERDARFLIAPDTGRLEQAWAHQVRLIVQ